MAAGTASQASQEPGQRQQAAQRLFARAAASSQQDSDSRPVAPPGAAGGSGCPVVGEVPGAAREADCPVVTPGFSRANLMPHSPNSAAPGQARPLDTQRMTSSIPRGGAEADAQAGGTPAWVYPSEQMFYNALRRKGWQPNEEDMSNVVSIHNAVNERAWREILRWEELHAGRCGAPRLKQFRGRPQDYSPKARLLNWLGYRLPFDRHDWVVDRCGRPVRYVIDFYNAAPLPDMPVAMHLDVRPALDSPGAVWDRLRMQMAWVASGRWRRE